MSYKILSLDGGGSWAMIQARVLKDIYGDMNGHELLRQFDMVISNSGGSLVLACLCNDMKLSEVINVFENESSRKKVFSKLSFFESLHMNVLLALFRNRLGIGPKYSAKRKLSGLTEVLKASDHLLKEGKIKKPIIETTLDELPAIIGKESLQLVIVGFDYFKERVSFFRSNRVSETDKFTKKFYATPLANAIHASSNAPVNYFDSPAVVPSFVHKPKPGFGDTIYNSTAWYWDGAIAGFNNPVLAGLIEAITNNAPVKDCCILSLGTGTGGKVLLTDKLNSDDPDDKLVIDANKKNDLVNVDTSFLFKSDIKKMATSILGDPPDSATFIAYSIIDPELKKDASLVRINPCYSPVSNKETKRFEVPAAFKNETNPEQALLNLLALDMDAVEPKEVLLITDLCNKFITDDSSNCLANQLIRGDVSSDNYLGYGTYAEAKKKWKQCIGLQ
ncbi:MAG: patatin-like phospholipase family protein [Ginsengibacter sp.]